MNADATQTELYLLESSIVPSSGRVVGFTGREALSELYRLSIALVTAGEEVDLAAARGLAATLRIRHGAGEDQVFHGMIAQAALRHAWQDRALYEVVVVPKVWAMTLTHYCRVFVDRSVPDIIEVLLDESGIGSSDYELRLHGRYHPHPHTCQYKESRWAFLSRLMEREGLYYFFEHGEQAEKLIITDHRSFHQPLRSVPARYVPLSGPDDAISGEALHSFGSEHASAPRQIKLRDWDYLNPSLDVKAEAVAWDECAADQVHIGEHDFRTSEAGQPLADVEAEAWRARELCFSAEGRVFGLRAGYLFEMEEHPLGSMNGEYLVVEVKHGGNQAAGSPMLRRLLGLPDADYHAQLKAIRASVQFRPSRRTPVPRISSVERGFIDGPANSEYAQIDEHGRYKVKLHFDIDDSELWDGEASTWIRMLQPHGGTTEGFHFPLRRNTEVMIVFLGGNPDRPVIAGAVPNAVQPSPVTRHNHTQNVLMTGGSNRFEIEDLDSKQYIDFSTPPQDTFVHLGEPHGEHSAFIVLSTGGNQLVNIGAVRDIEVGGHQNEHVVGNVSETYDAHHLTSVAAWRGLDVGDFRWNRIGGYDKREVGADDIISVDGARTDHVKSGVTEVYMTGHDKTVLGPHTVTVQGPQAVSVSGAQDIQAASRNDLVKGNVTQTIGGAVISKIGGLVENVGGSSIKRTGGSYLELNQSATAKCALAAKFELTAGAEAKIFAGLKAEAVASFDFKAQESVGVTFTGGAKAEFGSALNLRKAPVTIGEGQVSVTKAATIVLKADATNVFSAPVHVFL